MQPAVKRLVLRWSLALAALGLLVWLNGYGVGIPCPVYHFTGLYCPGCGSMRAIASLARLDLHSAWRYNPAVVLLLPLLALLLGMDVWHILRGRRRRPHRWEAPVAIGLAVALLAFGVLRNLPAFGFLAPPA